MALLRVDVVLHGEAPPPPLGPLPACLDVLLCLDDIELGPNAVAVGELVLEEGTDFQCSLHLAVAAVVSLSGPIPQLGHRQGCGATDGIHAGSSCTNEQGGPAKVAVVVGGLVGKLPHVMRPVVPELLPVKCQPLALQDVERVAALGRVVVPLDKLVFGMDGCW